MRLFVLLFVLLFAGVAACGGASSPGAPIAGEPEIASVWRARCGQCHIRVEPGTRTRQAIDAALPRHHKRVHLTDDQWSALAEWLAPTPAPAPAPAPS